MQGDDIQWTFSHGHFLKPALQSTMFINCIPTLAPQIRRIYICTNCPGERGSNKSIILCWYPWSYNEEWRVHASRLRISTAITNFKSLVSHHEFSRDTDCCLFTIRGKCKLREVAVQSVTAATCNHYDDTSASKYIAGRHIIVYRVVLSERGKIVPSGETTPGSQMGAL